MARSAFRSSRTFIGGIAALAVVCALPAAASAAPGQIDPTFGIMNNGTVLSDHGRSDVVVKVLRQTDGKILSVASANDDALGSAVVITRYLTNGRPDASFGSGGTFRVALSAEDLVSDAALQADGKIVVVGSKGLPPDFFIIRVRTNGTLDPAFVPANPTTNFATGAVDQAFAVAIAPSGKIVVVGRSNLNVAIARYTSTGALDTTFSGDGLVTHDFGGQSEADDVVVLPDQRIVVAGLESTSSGAPRVVLARFNDNGTLDATFGTAGRVLTTSTPIGSANTLLLQGTKLVIAGSISLATSGISRYSGAGVIDGTFGTAGTVQVPVGKFSVLRELLTDATGRLVAVGMGAYSDEFPGVASFVTLFRYSANGVRDAAFGCGGSVFTEVLGNGAGTNSNASGGTSAAVAGNDIVVGGFATAFNQTDFPPTDNLLARYDGDGPPISGYGLLRGDGGTSAFGGAPACGSVAGLSLNAPIVGGAYNRAAPGNWTVASDGGIFAFGAARFLGSMGGTHLNKPIVGMAATPDGKGYWLVASDGGIFSFGTARFFGSMGAIPLNQPVVGMAATADGKGYWLVARDGGIFAFGNAVFSGSMGGSHLNQPIVGMAADTVGTGYWLVARDGGVFSFAASYFGSAANISGRRYPIVGIAADPDGTGYWIAASDGGLYSFSARFSGSTGATPFPVGSPRSTIGIMATP